MSKLTYQSLSDCVHSLSGGTPPKSNDSFWSGDLPWVSSGEMGQSRITDTELHITQEAGENHSKIVPAGTVLVVVRGMSLAKEFRVSITQRKMAFNQDLKALITKENVNSSFLFYSLYGRRFEICKLASESAHGTKKLDSKVLDSIPVFLPAFSTQQKIAAIASAYDDLIENNDRRITLLEKMAEEIYREWFVRLRFPGHEQATFHKDIPESWEVTSLGQMTKVITKGTTPTTFGKPFVEQGINFIKIESIDNKGRFNEDKFAKIDLQTHELLKRSQLYAGDILFSIAGAIGVSALISEEILPANTNQALAIIRPEKKDYKQYLYYTIRSESFINFSLGRVVQTAQANVSLSILSSAKILKPIDEIMCLFNEKILPIANAMNTLYQKTKNLKQTRDRLLTRLISGKLSVEDLDIQFPPSMTEAVDTERQ
jgi:type I restriction enzyme, S subunit